jgi:hypothetical protein
MRIRVLTLAAALLAAAACGGDGGGGTLPLEEASLVLTGPPAMTARVAKAEYEAANGPAGPYAQHNLWLIVPPGVMPNAGVVVGSHIPVFIRRDGRTYAAEGGDVRVGDRVEVWTDPVFVGYGAVQAPPGAPVYHGDQVVIVR